MEKRLWFFCLMVMIIVLFSTGCELMVQANQPSSQISSKSSSDPEISTVPSNQADAKGKITEIKNNQIFVEEYPLKKQEGSKGLITLDSKTIYLQRKNGKLITGKREDLKRGSYVTVWCRGAHIMIYPLQCTASHVLLESDRQN